MVMMGCIGSTVEIRRNRRGVPYAKLLMAVCGEGSGTQWVDCIAWGDVAQALARGTNREDTIEIEGKVVQHLCDTPEGGSVSQMRPTIDHFRRMRKGRLSRILDAQAEKAV